MINLDLPFVSSLQLITFLGLLHPLKSVEKVLDIVRTRKVKLILDHKVRNTRYPSGNRLSHILIDLRSTLVAIDNCLLKLSFRDSRLHSDLLQNSIIRDIALFLKIRRKQPINRLLFNIMSITPRQSHQPMRVARVSCLSSILELDAHRVSDLGQPGLHHGGALGAEVVPVKVLLRDAGAGALRPFWSELEGVECNGESVIGVLGVPELLGALELLAADVAPGADGVGGDVDLDLGHDRDVFVGAREV